jgi:hypothetical protein
LSKTPGEVEAGIEDSRADGEKLFGAAPLNQTTSHLTPSLHTVFPNSGWRSRGKNPALAAGTVVISSFHRHAPTLLAIPHPFSLVAHSRSASMISSLALLNFTFLMPRLFHFTQLELHPLQ